MPDPLRRPLGSSAVMARRGRQESKKPKPELTPEEQAQVDLWRTLDFFPTPPWAARATAEIIRDLDPVARSVWEPACGNGCMSEPFREYFQSVLATDIFEHGPAVDMQQDFLDESFGWAEPGRFDWIVTNPPFVYGARFVELALRRARRGVAMLCRLQFVETEGRWPWMRELALFAPFVERTPMVLGRWDPKASSATAYAVFIWVKAPDIARPADRLRLIPPGTRDRLWRAEDVRRFATPGQAPLFAEGALTTG